MKASASTTGLVDSERQSRPTFNILMVYDHMTMGTRAMSVCRSALKDFGSDYEFAQTLWRLDLLSLPSISATAAEQVAKADMIIVSCLDLPHVTAALEDWISNRWPDRTGSPRGALVALLGKFGGEQEVRPETRSFLQRAADTANLDLFLQPVQAEEDVSDVTVEELSLRAQTRTSILEDFLLHTSPAPRWGLNE